MTVKVDRVRRRYRSLLAGDVLDVDSVDDEIDEASIPSMISIVYGSLVDIFEMAVVVDVEDAWA